MLVEDAGIDKLVFGHGAIAASVFDDELVVRKGKLGVFIQPLHVGVSGGGIEIVIILFDVLAVIALRPGNAEEPLLQDGIAPVPERESDAKPLMVVADAHDSVLGPAVRSRTRIIMGEISPGIAVSAVILARVSPGTLGKIGSPSFPVLFVAL